MQPDNKLLVCKIDFLLITKYYRFHGDLIFRLCLHNAMNFLLKIIL